MRLPLITITGLLASAVVLAQEPPLQFGVTDTFGSPMACAIFDEAELQPGQPLLFIAFDPQRWVRGRIVQQRTTVCRSDSILVGTPYDVQLDEPEGFPGELGVSVIGPDLMPEREGEALTFIRASSGEAITFRTCTSNEGVHFFALEGNMELWHEYYHVPYSIEPTCRDSDFRSHVP